MANRSEPTIGKPVQPNVVYVHPMLSSLFTSPGRHLTYSVATHDDVIKWNPFRVTDPLCGEFTGRRWITLTNASNAELWCFRSQITRFMGPTWGPPESCRSKMGPMLAPWILLSGLIYGWTNGWANNRNTGALRRHCVHSDIGLISISNECHLIKMHIYSNPQHFCT